MLNSLTGAGQNGWQRVKVMSLGLGACRNVEITLVDGFKNFTVTLLHLFYGVETLNSGMLSSLCPGTS